MYNLLEAKRIASNEHTYRILLSVGKGQVFCEVVCAVCYEILKHNFLQFEENISWKTLFPLF